jgi:hypothetical protein
MLFVMIKKTSEQARIYTPKEVPLGDKDDVSRS